MPKINVTRSATIHSPIKDVYSKLSDLNHWVHWSPWLIMENGVNINVSGDGKFYTWKGARVGEGEMKVTLENPNNSIEYDLIFLKPWKSKANVKFLLSDNNDRTTVTWSMNSKLPFFMFWMKKIMEAYIGADYHRGLLLLKDYMEQGEVQSRLEFKGTSTFSETKYIGLKRSCTIDKVSGAMATDFEKLGIFAKHYSDITTNDFFTIYHKRDLFKGKVDYTRCVGVSEIPENLSGDFVTGIIPKTKVYTLRHIGHYHHLGNAWSTLYNMHRGKEFKSAKGIHPFEHYVSDTQKTDGKNLITDVIFPIQ